MKAHLILVAVFALAACVAHDFAPAGDADKRLEGKWKATAGVLDGKKLDTAKGVFVVFRGKQYQFVGGQEESGTFDLDPTKTPNAIDLRPTTGEVKGKLRRGIVVFKGDELRLCVGAAEETRPTKFASPPGDDRLLLTLKRMRP